MYSFIFVEKKKGPTFAYLSLKLNVKTLKLLVISYISHIAVCKYFHTTSITQVNVLLFFLCSSCF